MLFRSFTRNDGTTLHIDRPVGLQEQPLINITTHGINGNNVWTKSPSGLSSAYYSALQTYSGNKFTGLTIYGLNATNTGIATSGATTMIITFGLIS